MPIKTQQTDRRRGSVMILVVVVTVLLAVVGVMFVMVSRLGEMETSAVIDSRDLDASVDSVVSRIHSVLVEDLFGTDGRMLSGADDPDLPGPDERWDYAEHTVSDSVERPWQDSIYTYVDTVDGRDKDGWLPGKLDDIWLASLEPVLRYNEMLGAEEWVWPQITDLWGTLQGRTDSLYHQQFTAVEHEFFVANPGVQWVDPPDENLQNVDVNWDIYGVSAYRVLPKIITPGSRTGVVADRTDGSAPHHFAPYGARADASGDGVADSRWVQVPNLTTSRGKPVYAAVRIMDNSAMLNLNTAFGFYQDAIAEDERPWHSKPWFVSQVHMNNNLPYDADFGQEVGRVLGEVNATPFLRAYDRNRVERLRRARDPVTVFNPSYAAPTPEEFFDYFIMNIESPGLPFTPFGIDDELEIRNRFLLTSKAVARFEKRHLDSEARGAIPPQSYSGTLYYTFDYGRGTFEYDQGGYGKSRVARTPFTMDNFGQWYDKLNPIYFDWNPDSETLDDFVYDRRHVTTFYSYDRPLRSGRYPVLDAALADEMIAQQRRARESVFRPLDFRPIDMRRLTDPDNLDRITANTPGARRHILHLLYAFRAYFLPDDYDDLEGDERNEALASAAGRSAQVVANLIDYLDGSDATEQGPFYDDLFGRQDNPDPTFINRRIIRELIREVSTETPGAGTIDIGLTAPTTLNRYEFGLGLDDADEIVYGFERQPFLSEVYSHYHYDADEDSDSVRTFAIELYNPYDEPISIDGWRFQFGDVEMPLSGEQYEVPAHSDGGRLVIWAGEAPYFWSDPAYRIQYTTAGFLSAILDQKGNETLTLERPDPYDSEDFLTVDRIREEQLAQFFNEGIHTAKRVDTQWQFANAGTCRQVRIDYWDSTLGSDNLLSLEDAHGYQLPVANREDQLVPEPFYTLGDFTQVAFISNEKGTEDSKTITEKIAAADTESLVRLDVAQSPELLDYLCFLNRHRDDENPNDKTKDGTLPGRININTAAKHVIAAAIPPQLAMAEADDPEGALYLAEQIIAHRPYQRISDLLKIEAFAKYAQEDSPNVGDPLIEGDIQERDWILSRLSNIFTVRSDVFTAYILVRLGQDGPERRMIAVFDRSQVWSPDDRPKLVALHPVPDPR